ncbi:hypothetical protein HU200_002118 [Digitaria exilis]|uniref:Large ribosomal subunit protein uL29c n=1 Tax=Digitaria exilis TaxID=1010633 RepID=A0A835FYX0_9POAL|nr:hypothetical protein HU200_002118 [Digitaria exilis]
MATMSLAAASPLISTPRGVGAPAPSPRTALLALRLGAAQATRFSGLVVSSQPVERRAAALVAMAKREQELEEIRGMTTEQLEEEVVDLKGELFLLRLKRSARQEFKNSEFGRMRKRVYCSLHLLLFELVYELIDLIWKISIVNTDVSRPTLLFPSPTHVFIIVCLLVFLSLRQIARMLTVKREREIEQGINKRLSRKLDRKWKQSIVVRPPPSLRENKEE